jgi:hypothetical protein
LQQDLKNTPTYEIKSKLSKSKHIHSRIFLQAKVPREKSLHVGEDHWVSQHLIDHESKKNWKAGRNKTGPENGGKHILSTRVENSSQKSVSMSIIRRWGARRISCVHPDHTHCTHRGMRQCRDTRGLISISIARFPPKNENSENTIQGANFPIRRPRRLKKELPVLKHMVPYRVTKDVPRDWCKF